MGGSGSKGDSQETEVKLPPELEKFANRNLGNAEAAARIGFVPYGGPTEAALNPMQMASMDNTQDMLSAFGLGGADPRAGLPEAKDYGGGIKGYDPMSLYLQALAMIDPEQRKAIESFSDPSGARASFGGGGGGGGGARPATPAGRAFNGATQAWQPRNRGNPYFDGGH